MEVRLNRYLAMCGVASRRAADKLIASGECCVNGRVVTRMGCCVNNDSDTVTVGGRIIRLPVKKTYLMLNKPRGYITSAKDQFGRPIVMDLIKSDERLFPVGRLDCDTSGLLIVTDDGELSYRLTHPKHGVVKTYIAEITGRPTDQSAERFRRGLDIGGYTTAPADFEIIGKNQFNTKVMIKISEGKNRQVKIMCECIGHPVVSLHRTAIGELRLSDVKTGEYRELTDAETAYLSGL